MHGARLSLFISLTAMKGHHASRPVFCAVSQKYVFITHLYCMVKNKKTDLHFYPMRQAPRTIGYEECNILEECISRSATFLMKIGLENMTEWSYDLLDTVTFFRSIILFFLLSMQFQHSIKKIKIMVYLTLSHSLEV